MRGLWRQCEGQSTGSRSHSCRRCPVVSQGQPKDNANLRAPSNFDTLEGRLMCCVVFCSVFQRYFILLFRSTHTCTWRASWVRVEQSPSCVLFSFLFRTKRKGYAGLGQEIAWFMRPPDVADNPLMSFGLLHCISFACRRPPSELHISIDSLELRADIIFPFGAVCLSWLGKLFTHPELGRANSRFNCKFPRIGHH